LLECSTFASSVQRQQISDVVNAKILTAKANTKVWTIKAKAWTLKAKA